MDTTQNFDSQTSGSLPVLEHPDSVPQSAGSGLQILARVGKDAHRHVLVSCRCTCGRVVTIRKDKAAHQQTCGACAPTTAPEQGARTSDVILAELSDNAAALLTMEKDIVLLSRQLAQEGVQPAGPDGDSTAKRFRETCTTAGIARKERKRLEKELRELSGQKAVTLSSTESVLARARNMRGGK